LPSRTTSKRGLFFLDLGESEPSQWALGYTYAVTFSTLPQLSAAFSLGEALQIARFDASLRRYSLTLFGVVDFIVTYVVSAICSAIYFVIYFALTRLPWKHFPESLGVYVLVLGCSLNMYLLSTAISRKTTIGLSFILPYMSLCFFLNGVVPPLFVTPSWLRWLAYTSPFSWAMVALTLINLQDGVDPGDPSYADSGQLVVDTAKDYFGDFSISTCTFVIIGMTAFFSVLRVVVWGFCFAPER